MKSSPAEQREKGDRRQDTGRSAEPLQRQAHDLCLRQGGKKEVKRTQIPWLHHSRMVRLTAAFGRAQRGQRGMDTHRDASGLSKDLAHI